MLQRSFPVGANTIEHHRSGHWRYQRHPQVRWRANFEGVVSIYTVMQVQWPWNIENACTGSLYEAVDHIQAYSLSSCARSLAPSGLLSPAGPLAPQALGLFVCSLEFITLNILYDGQYVQLGYYCAYCLSTVLQGQQSVWHQRKHWGLKTVELQRWERLQDLLRGRS